MVVLAHFLYPMYYTRPPWKSAHCCRDKRAEIKLYVCMHVCMYVCNNASTD